MGLNKRLDYKNASTSEENACNDSLPSLDIARNTVALRVFKEVFGDQNASHKTHTHTL